MPVKTSRLKKKTEIPLHAGLVQILKQHKAKTKTDYLFAKERAAHARAKGVKLGRPATLDEHEPAVKLLMSQGAGVREVARRLRLPVASAFRLVRKVQAQPTA